MNKILTMALTLSLLASTASFAADGRHDNQGQDNQGRGYDHQQGDKSPPAARDQRDNKPQDTHRQDDRNGNSGWARGQRVPDQYRNNKNYVVNDWQRRNLRQPPRGYHWVRNDGNQFFLTLIATGIIAEVVLQNSYRPPYQWTRGQRLDGYYMDNRYVVTNWQRAHLHRPWRGHHWVRINDRYMMIRDRNGEIVEIVVIRR